VSDRALPRVLVAHERPAVCRVVARVLEQEGFVVAFCERGKAALAKLVAEPWDALVVDVALPELPCYELCERARSLAATGTGARVVVLVASVYRATSYKRRPTRLYGADDYIEIHHLGDALPTKLRKLLGLAPVPKDMHLDAAEALRVEGDARMTQHDDTALAKLIVADMVLYNGDRILGAPDANAAASAVAADLEVARDLFGHVARARGKGPAHGDPIGDAFAELMSALGRAQVPA
jgi:DNA-binding response OmpR family regulator